MFFSFFSLVCVMICRRSFGFLFPRTDVLLFHHLNEGFSLIGFSRIIDSSLLLLVVNFLAVRMLVLLFDGICLAHILSSLRTLVRFRFFHFMVWDIFVVCQSRAEKKTELSHISLVWWFSGNSALFNTVFVHTAESFAPVVRYRYWSENNICKYVSSSKYSRDFVLIPVYDDRNQVERSLRDLSYVELRPIKDGFVSMNSSSCWSWDMIGVDRFHITSFYALTNIKLLSTLFSGRYFFTAFVNHI